MFSGLVRRVQLTVVSKTGISGTVVTFAAIAAVAAVVAFVFLLFSAFIWLAERYSPLTGALILTGFFLLLAILCAVGCLVSHKRTADQAKRELERRSQSPLFDPRFLAVGMQVGKSIGMRRIVPLVAAGLLAASLAKEWFGAEGQSGENYDA